MQLELNSLGKELVFEVYVYSRRESSKTFSAKGISTWSR